MGGPEETLLIRIPIKAEVRVGPWHVGITWHMTPFPSRESKKAREGN